MTEQALVKPIYCCLLKSISDKYVVFSEKDGGIICFKSLEDALSLWDRAYDSAFARGLGGATGAILGHMALNPSIIHFKNEAEMIDALFNKPPFSLCRLYSWNYGIECQKDASNYWKEGVKPELIKRI